MSRLAVLVAVMVMPAGAPAASRPPNIAIVFADDLGTFDLGCFGHPSIRTPHLDAMAREGAILTQWLSAAPICTPSRSSLYTGRLPIRTGLYANAVHYSKQRQDGNPRNATTFGLDAWQHKDGTGGLPQSEITLPELLGTRGYASLLVGKCKRRALFPLLCEPSEWDCRSQGTSVSWQSTGLAATDSTATSALSRRTTTA